MGLYLFGALSFVLIPWLWSDAMLSLTNFFILGLCALSLNVLYGYTGLLSLGQGVYFALGAYGATLAVIHGGVNFWVALATGPVLAFLGALAVGWISVRTSGYGFVVVTLVTALVFYLLALGADSLTGGDDGMSFQTPSINLWERELRVQDLPVRYYLALAALLVGFGVVRLVMVSPLGLAFRLVRENERRAAFLGYDVFQIRLASFVLAGVLAGLAGVVWALSKEFVRAGLFQPFGAFIAAQPDPDPLIAVLLGGAGTLLGPLVGTGILLGLREFFVRFWPQGYVLAMGVVILLIVRYAPGGVTGFFKR
jgi:branched-chain amino acid transport system permease protein